MIFRRPTGQHAATPAMSAMRSGELRPRPRARRASRVCMPGSAAAGRRVRHARSSAHGAEKRSVRDHAGVRQATKEDVAEKGSPPSSLMTHEGKPEHYADQAASCACRKLFELAFVIQHLIVTVSESNSIQNLALCLRTCCSSGLLVLSSKTFINTNHLRTVFFSYTESTPTASY